VEIATERGDPSVANGWRIRAILGGIPGIVVGWFALGPAIVVIAVAVVAIVCGLLVTGPPINLRLYGTTRGATALLHVCSAVERRSGTLDVEPGRLCWTPWKRYESAAKGIDVDRSDVERAVLFARRGLPASCRLELHLRDGATQNVTVFAKAVSVEGALRSM
jgi:hypothetical protein